MNRTTYPSQNLGLGRVYVEFSFTTNNTATPLTSTIDGIPTSFVASFNRTGVGVIVVTLTDSFNKCITATADLDDTANDGAYATVGNIANEGTSSGLTFTIRTRAAAGTLADFTGRKCNVLLALRNTTAGK